MNVPLTFRYSSSLVFFKHYSLNFESTDIMMAIIVFLKEDQEKLIHEIILFEATFPNFKLNEYQEKTIIPEILCLYLT